MAPSYEQNTAKSRQIHTTVNLPFKRPVHKWYMEDKAWLTQCAVELRTGHLGVIRRML